MRILVVPAWHNISDPLYASFFHEFCEAMTNFCDITMLDINLYSFSEKCNFKPKKDAYGKRKYSYLAFNYFNSIPGSFFGLNTRFQKKQMIKKATKLVNNFQLDKGKFDVVHILSVCNSISPILAYHIALKNNIPYVITEHYSGFTNDANHIYYPYTNRVEITKIVQSASLRFGVSNYACQIFENYFRVPFEVLPNLVNGLFESELPACSIKGDTDSLVFLCIGRFEKNKGQLNLVNVFSKLLSKYPNVKLKLVGDGIDKQDIISFLGKINTSRIIIEDWKSKKQLINEIDCADIIVSASLKETFGLTIAEGFFRGKPVLAIDSGGPKDLINTDNGVLVPKNDQLALQSSIEYMINNHNKYNRELIRDNAMSKYSEMIIGKKTFNLYQSLKY